MAYVANLGEGRSLTVNNVNQQTVITLSSSSAGQQQSQSSGFATGTWTVPPTLFCSSAGVILRVTTEQGQTFVQIQNNQMQLLTIVPHLAEIDVVPMQSVSSSPPASMPEIQPIQPMQPMKMGSMEMQMNPMQMRMGDMELRMGGASSETPQKKFCSQCGTQLQAGDRFCSQCGHRIQ